MPHPEELNRLNAEISSQMGHLDKSLVRGIALYVYATVVLQHCGQTRVATFLSGLLDKKFDATRQQIRELTYDSEEKRGQKRQQIKVSSCFAPLLSWVLSKFQGDQRQVVVALDATYLRDRFTVLCVSVVVAGCAIPVAWHIQQGDAAGEWNPIWKRLVRRVACAIPKNWQVFVLTDSGLYSKTLYTYLTKTRRWHVFMRTDHSNGFFRPKGSCQWQLIADYLTSGMTPVMMQGTCFKSNPISCTLILQWQPGYQHPCILISNVAPHLVDSNIYAVRYWIECGFKDIKRGLFHWEQTKMQAPHRAERLWLVLSIALLWVTAVGEHALEQSSWKFLNATATQSRRLSAPVLGIINILVALCKQEPLPDGYLNPYIWCSILDP